MTGPATATFGRRAAAFLQKLPWRRKAKSGDRFGLLSS